METEPHPRRLLAILYADMAGFSRLTGEDEDMTHRWVRHSLTLFSDTIEAYSGRVVHYAGDAVLARFDAVVDALQTALAVQAELYELNLSLPEHRQILFRIGINLGDVIEDGHEIYGNEVNVAARLESMAEPGGICVSEAARDALGRRLPVSFEYMGEQAAKNIAELLRVYRVVPDPLSVDENTGNAPDSVPAPPGEMPESPWVALMRTRREIDRTRTSPGPHSTTPLPNQAEKSSTVQKHIVPNESEGSGPSSSVTLPTEYVEVSTSDDQAEAGIGKPVSGVSAPDVIPVTAAQAVAGAVPPAIVVLPFLDMTNDPALVCLADGITEDLITEISRFKSLRVIARTSAFAFKGKDVGHREIADALGVDFLLEGSIRAIGERLRVTAQLIDCRHGGHLWADNEDCHVRDIFDVQDRFVAEVARVLEDRIVDARFREVARAPVHSLEAYDCWLRGVRLMRDWSSEADREARVLFDRAITLDPDFARPYASLASICSSSCVLEPGNPELDDELRRALEYGRKAVKLDAYDASVHASIGWTQMVRGDFDGARRSFAHAAELNPNDADIAISRALITAYLGDTERALAIAAGAMERNPLHPDYYRGYVAIIHCLARDFHRALDRFEEMAELNPPDFWAWRAAAEWHLGRFVQAQVAAETFVQNYAAGWYGVSEGTTVDFVAWLVRITPLARKDDQDMLFDGITGAGLPRPGTDDSPAMAALRSSALRS
jgi:adenylate cyclase